MKREKTILGPMEMQLFAYAQMRKKDMIFKGEIASVLGINTKQENELLSRLGRSGIIIRLKKGVYLIPPRMPAGGRWAVSEYLILSKLMEINNGKYQISGPNAFNFYGFDDQIPNSTYVYNNRISGDKNIGGVQFVFIKVTDSRLGSIKKFSTADGIKIRIASKARVLVDAVYDWSRYNTIPRAYGWIASSLDKDLLFVDELIKVTLKYSNKATIRRIGYLLNYIGVSLEKLESLMLRIGSSKTYIPWIPKKDAIGRINKDWGLIINGTL